MNQNSRIFFTHKICLEITIILFTILLAGFLGNCIALLATEQITDMLTRFVVGIFIGFLVGIGVGILMKRTWEKTQLLFLKWNRNKNTI